MQCILLIPQFEFQNQILLSSKMHDKNDLKEQFVEWSISFGLKRLFEWPVPGKQSAKQSAKQSTVCSALS